MQRRQSRAKMYLLERQSEIRGIDDAIDRKRERLAKLRARLTDGTTILTGMPGGGSNGVNGQFEKQTHLLEIAEEINADIDRLARKQGELAEIIGRCANEQHRAVLELRYIDGMDWRKIARKMHYDNQYIFRIHGKALQELDKQLDSKR